MAINTDGPKRQGRFLKKNSKLASSVQLVDFSFEEICTQPLVGFDNMSRSIIHSKFHDPKNLDAVVRQHTGMEEKVIDANTQQLGIIFPADFTQDWHNERLQGKRRAMGFDEEDEIDFAAVARNRGQAAAAAAAAAASAADPAANPPKDIIEAATAPVNGKVIDARPSPITAVRAPESDGKVISMSEVDLASAISKEFVADLNDYKNQKEQIAQTIHESPAAENSFTPLPTESGPKAIAAEDLAIESWKMKQLAAKQNEEILDNLRAEARAEGFQSGFRDGEEKGLLSGQQHASQLFGKVGEILHEFENLKELLLDNVQKNFYELSQAVAESLLGREFSIHPEAYATMIQRVIKDTTAPNKFKVRMHPDTWQKVHELAVPDLDEHLLKDPSIPLGEFRVESALTVVDVSAKKLVSQLLENADIQLFTDKKVS